MHMEDVEHQFERQYDPENLEDLEALQYLMDDDENGSETDSGIGTSIISMADEDDGPDADDDHGPDDHREQDEDNHVYGPRRRVCYCGYCSDGSYHGDDGDDYIPDIPDFRDTADIDPYSTR